MDPVLCKGTLLFPLTAALVGATELLPAAEDRLLDAFRGDVSTALLDDRLGAVQCLSMAVWLL